MQITLLFLCASVLSVTSANMLKSYSGRNEINVKAADANQTPLSLGAKRVRKFSVFEALGKLVSAGAQAAFTDFIERSKTQANDQCRIHIRWYAYRANDKFKVNFKTSGGQDNSLTENLDSVVPGYAVDWDFENIRRGGWVSLVQIYPQGRSCIESFSISCGPNAIGNDGAAVRVTVEHMRQNWIQNKGNRGMRSVWWNPSAGGDSSNEPCVWFGGNDGFKALDVRREAFLCKQNDFDCVRNNIETF